MGTKIQSKSYLPGFYSMRDLNEDSNSRSWPLYYGDKTLRNGQYYNSFFPKAVANSYPQHDKDRLKRKMLEHEAIFQNQLSELHRLYRIQRDLMVEAKNKELQKNQIPVELSSSSSLLTSQLQNEVAHDWHIPNFSVANSVCGRPSISGVEDAHSPLSSVKGSSIQAGPFLSPNGLNSKDVEVLDCRPIKVRKIFDLQLPADKYIDTDEAEEFRDDTTSGMSSYLPNGNGKIGPESGGKQDACLRGKNSLADLNDPVQIEETEVSTFSHFVGHDTYHGGRESSAKPKPALLGLPKDISVNSHHQSDNRSVNNMHVGKNENARGFFSHVLEGGHSRSNSTFISQSFQPQKLSLSYQHAHGLFDKAHDPPMFSPTDQSEAGLSRERMLHSLEVPGRNCEISNNSNPDSNMGFNVPSLGPFASSDPENLWSHSVSSSEKPSSSLNLKSMSVQACTFMNSSDLYSKSSVISPHCDGNLGEKWPASSNSRLNPGFGRELPNRNGFCYGSLLGSKELAIHFLSTSYDYANGAASGKGIFDQFSAHGSTKPYNCSNDGDMKSTSDMNLNVVLSNSSSNNPVSLRGPQIDGGIKHGNHSPWLPWLKAKPACKNEGLSAGMDLNVRELSFSQSSPQQSTKEDEIGNGFGQMFTQNLKSDSSSNNADASRSEISECLRDKKILGIPIFEKPHVPKNESSFTSPYVSVPRTSEGEGEYKWKNRLLDINLPCDVTVDASQDIVAENSTIEQEADKKLSCFKHQIDLNSCADEDEASFIPNVSSTSVRMTGGIIDLEAPLVPEPENVIHGEELSAKEGVTLESAAQSQDECIQHELKSAAEAIVAISSSIQHIHLEDVSSSSSETSTSDPLNWFAKTVSSFCEDLESKLEAFSRDKDEGRDESSLEEIDYFESMILNLAETKEEDYMPKPLVPENFKVEETGITSLLTTRTRKGQGRRGRQRRDFQRDILPGLVSLSRHEVTQDIQTFGSLMRATGHQWQSGLTRRNSNRGGCGRGRRHSVTSSPPAATSCTPLVQQLNNIKLGPEDRSLTGWGKTTRRPRRQRCPQYHLLR
ncbi:protein O-linked-mannose beta-1,4-N-acetylglucosaminyltransferase 2-like [Hibiscus syriacus]|uniref:Protein O-linked-mannose beta-1,4-N-acetylglucosaminyltransferase 2-like n=1 Tax=Hibiscus syriacus TaxID=106335 RepID=A0A6A3BU03_HIBSY|nr:uncharacterized protein LOC120211148 [Hibiscus syriacus]KAE8719417.1 protein O-linked-mannose beta-1,4-N-acetylglucosaminyltransferase 2-like [Hibiscus syriacus]